MLRCAGRPRGMSSSSQSETGGAGLSLSVVNTEATKAIASRITAPAITSFSTAVFPAEHANPGWFCWSEATASVVRTLPMDVRAAPDQPVIADGLWDWRSMSLQFGVPVVMVTGDQVAVAQIKEVATEASSVVVKRAINGRTGILTSGRPVARMTRSPFSTATIVWASAGNDWLIEAYSRSVPRPASICPSFCAGLFTTI